MMQYSSGFRNVAFILFTLKSSIKRMISKLRQRFTYSLGGSTATVKLIPLAVDGRRIETKMGIEPFEPSLKKAKVNKCSSF